MQPKSARAVADENGNPLIVAADIMAAVGYQDFSNVPAAIAHVPAEWRTTKRIKTLDGFQQMDVLTEQGLYFFMGPSLSR